MILLCIFVKAMNQPNGFELIPLNDQARFLRLQDFSDELNLMLFEVEEMLALLQPLTEEFFSLSLRYDTIVDLAQELQDDLATIGQVYGDSFIAV